MSHSHRLESFPPTAPASADRRLRNPRRPAAAVALDPTGRRRPPAEPLGHRDAVPRSSTTPGVPVPTTVQASSGTPTHVPGAVRSSRPKRSDTAEARCERPGGLVERLARRNRATRPAVRLARSATRRTVATGSARRSFTSRRPRSATAHVQEMPDDRTGRRPAGLPALLGGMLLIAVPPQKFWSSGRTSAGCSEPAPGVRRPGGRTA